VHMNAKYITPVILSVQNVFETMIQLPVVSGKQFFKTEKRPTTDVICMITMSGPVSGLICLGISKELAFLLSSKLLDCVVSEANGDCSDAIGEITNMIAGNAPATAVPVNQPGGSFFHNGKVIGFGFDAKITNKEDEMKGKTWIDSAIALMILTSIATYANAQSLWNGTEYGMSPDQVKSMFSDASPPVDPGTWDKGNEVELLRLKNIVIVNKQFYVSFVFKNEKLTQVIIRLIEKPHFELAMSVFDSLIEALRSKYGGEINRNNFRSTNVKTSSASWMSGKTNISLEVMSVAGNNAILQVSYNLRLSQEADKL
jgi:hypothetical protein